MPKKLKPSEDPSLFEYEPHEDQVSDDELCELFHLMGKDPENIEDPAFKAKYLAYIESQQKKR